MNDFRDVPGVLAGMVTASEKAKYNGLSTKDERSGCHEPDMVYVLISAYQLTVGLEMKRSECVG